MVKLNVPENNSQLLFFENQQTILGANSYLINLLTRFKLSKLKYPQKVKKVSQHAKQQVSFYFSSYFRYQLTLDF